MWELVGIGVEVYLKGVLLLELLLYFDQFSWGLLHAASLAPENQRFGVHELGFWWLKPVVLWVAETLKPNQNLEPLLTSAVLVDILIDGFHNVFFVKRTELLRIDMIKPFLTLISLYKHFHLQTIGLKLVDHFLKVLRVFY